MNICLIIYLTGIIAALIFEVVWVKCYDKSEVITIGDVGCLIATSLASWGLIILAVLATIIYGLIKLNEAKFWKKRVFVIHRKKSSIKELEDKIFFLEVEIEKSKNYLSHQRETLDKLNRKLTLLKLSN